MGTYLETAETRDLVLLATDIRHQYHKARDKWYRSCGFYYRQSSASTYCSEDDIEEQFNQCRKLKADYLKICDILKKRGRESSL